MMHVRPALAALALAASLAACDAGRSLTEPALGNAKAARGERAGSGFTMHADNGGTYGSGYDVSACLANTGGAGSGYDVCLPPENARLSAAVLRVAKPRAIPAARDPRGLSVRADCILRTADNGGWVGSGYNFCP